MGSSQDKLETIQIDFSTPISFNSLLLKDHNLSSYEILIKSGDSYIKIPEASGFNGALQKPFDLDASFYYFDLPISTSSIKIEMKNTRKIDNKYLNEVIITNLIGQFKGYRSWKVNLNSL